MDSGRVGERVQVLEERVEVEDDPGIEEVGVFRDVRVSRLNVPLGRCGSREVCEHRAASPRDLKQRHAHSSLSDGAAFIPSYLLLLILLISPSFYTLVAYHLSPFDSPEMFSFLKPLCKSYHWITSHLMSWVDTGGEVVSLIIVEHDANL